MNDAWASGLRRRVSLAAFCSALFLLFGCRTSQPPKIEVCVLDGFGGGDCVEADGSQLYRTPSQMKDYWATSQPDEANFASWCYDTNSSAVKAGMADIESRARQ